MFKNSLDQLKIINDQIEPANGYNEFESVTINDQSEQARNHARPSTNLIWLYLDFPAGNILFPNVFL